MYSFEEQLSPHWFAPIWYFHLFSRSLSGRLSHISCPLWFIPLFPSHFVVFSFCNITTTNFSYSPNTFVDYMRAKLTYSGISHACWCMVLIGIIMVWSRPCSLVLPFPSVCPPPWHTTLSRWADSTAPLISLISLAVLSLRSLPCLCVCVCLSPCECLLRVMATNDEAEPASRCQDSDSLSLLLLSGCFSVTKKSQWERWNCYLEWWNGDVGRKDGKGKCKEKRYVKSSV